MTGAQRFAPRTTTTLLRSGDVSLVFLAEAMGATGESLDAVTWLRRSGIEEDQQCVPQTMIIRLAATLASRAIERLTRGRLSWRPLSFYSTSELIGVGTGAIR